MTRPYPRILHAPFDVGGHAFGLSRAERQLGLCSDVAVIASEGFGFGADIRLPTGGPLPLRAARQLRLLIDAIRGYDIIHFNFGQTFLNVWRAGRVLDELPLLRHAGKTILATFQGCDVRPPEYCYCRRAQCRRWGRYRPLSASRFLRYADRCFHLNPDLGQWLPGSQFLPYASVDPRVLRPPPPGPKAGPGVVVAHAPTDRDVKGTAHVIAAVDRLRAEGVPIRLDLIEGVVRTDVLRRLATADIVVDQLMVGWYGGFAAEAMCLAKPVVCRIDEHAAVSDTFRAELPIVHATPATLPHRLRELATDPELRIRSGGAARQFVERCHDPRSVARTVLSGIVELPTVAKIAVE